jgi:hypothetical protein
MQMRQINVFSINLILCEEKSLEVDGEQIIYTIVLFVETPRKFITAKLSIRKPGSSSVLIIRDLFNSHALFIYKNVVICWLASFENLIKWHINHIISNVVK